MQPLRATELRRRTKRLTQSEEPIYCASDTVQRKCHSCRSCLVRPKGIQMAKRLWRAANVFAIDFGMCS